MVPRIPAGAEGPRVNSNRLVPASQLPSIAGLRHWDLPQALEDLGGWQNRGSAAWFADYTTLIAGRFSHRVKRFATKAARQR